MDPKATFGTLYKITAQHSGRVLDLATILDTRFDPPFAPGPPPFSNTHLIQFGFHDSDNQKFLLFPQDDGAYVIANLSTGEVLDIARASSEDSTPCIGHSFKAGANQEFVLNVLSEDIHTIEAKHSGKVLDVFKASQQDRVRVFQHHATNGQNQRFRFESVGEYTLPHTGLEVGVLGPIPSPSSIDDNLPAETLPVPIEERMLPYFAVNDTLSRDTAVKTSPYYSIRREAFWRRTLEKRFEGPSRTEKFSFVSGMTEVTSRSVEATLGLSLGSEVSGPAKLTKMFNLSLKVTDTTSTTTTFTTTIEREFTYKGGAPLLLVEYVLVDRFTIRRTDGTAVTIPWEITNGDVVHQDAFPNEPG